MADSEISQLHIIADGSLAEARIFRENFDYLDRGIKAISQTQDGIETTDHKGKANGYCPLNGNAVVPDDNLGSIPTSISTLQANYNDNTVRISGKQTIEGNKTFSGTNTFSGTIKVPNTTSTGTAISNVGISKGQNGYAKFGTGLLIQWGYKSITTGNKNYTIEYSTSFTGATHYSITFTSKRSEMGDWTPIIVSKEKNKCVFRADNNDTVYWVAIGY